MIQLFFLVLQASNSFAKTFDHFTNSEDPFNNKQRAISNIINGFNSVHRPFYVRLIYNESTFICSGTVIGIEWVLSTAECLHVLNNADNLSVELRQSSNLADPVRLYEVNDFFIHEDYDYELEPFCNLALLQLREPIRSPENPALPICENEPSGLDTLAAVGMGPTSLVSRTQTTLLKEAFFYPTTLRIGLFFTSECPLDLICTLPAEQGWSICNEDAGGPLFKLKCGTRIPECLYGISSFSENNRCGGGSFFTNLLLFKDWINEIRHDFSIYEIEH